MTLVLKPIRHTTTRFQKSLSQLSLSSKALVAFIPSQDILFRVPAFFVCSSCFWKPRVLTIGDCRSKRKRLCEVLRRDGDDGELDRVGEPDPESLHRARRLWRRRQHFLFSLGSSSLRRRRRWPGPLRLNWIWFFFIYFLFFKFWESLGFLESESEVSRERKSRNERKVNFYIIFFSVQIGLIF